jgi:hypothetical protein
VIIRRTGLPTALVALASLAAGGCGGKPGQPSGPLNWVGNPIVLRPAQAPDRVLRGKIQNDGLRPLTLVAKDFALLDRDGDRVPAVATFAVGLVHSLYPPDREPQLPEAEERRLGRRVILKPGATATLTVAWRDRRGHSPVSISYVGGRLPVPGAR